MADKANKYPDNASGGFYVDTQCIDCDLCRQTAPDNFERHAKNGYSFVSRQPKNEEEAQLCQQALEECPVEAIGNNGGT